MLTQLPSKKIVSKGIVYIRTYKTSDEECMYMYLYTSCASMHCIHVHAYM